MPIRFTKSIEKVEKQSGKQRKRSKITRKYG